MRSRVVGRSSGSSLQAEVGARPLLNEEESPLSWLARRKDKEGQPLISATEYSAGEQLRSDFHLAHLEPHVTSNWTPLPGGGARRGQPGAGVDMADAVLAARERVNRALASVGPELTDVLLDVCCYLKGLESLERASGWPQRSGKIILRIALQALARHYGFERAAPRGVRIRHWGTEDYKPRADAET